VSVATARPFTTLPASSRLRGRPFSSLAPPVFLNLYPEYRNQPIPRVPHVGIYYVQKGGAVAWRAPDRRTCRRQPTLTTPRAKEYPNGISLLRESESSLVLPPVTERFLFPTRFPRWLPVHVSRSDSAGSTIVTIEPPSSDRLSAHP
jgi:hypothetical protein